MTTSAIQDRQVTGQPAPLLELKHVVKEFPVTQGSLFRRRVGSVHAASGVDLVVAEAETLGLVGESGCGKTTLGRMMVALERPTSGEIWFEGENIARLRGPTLRRKRRAMQFMFQDPFSSLDPHMRIGDIVAEPLRIQGVGDRRQQQARVRDLLNEVGLAADAMSRHPHEFSGGQRQRIGLARAIALNPRLVVADEPVSALDVSIRSQILNLMNRLQATHGLTYVVISHDLSVIRYIADRIAVMYLGKIVELGPSKAVYERPAHPYTRGLLSAIPIPDPVVERAKTVAVPKGEIASAINPPSGCRYRTRCPFAQEICAAVEPPLRAFRTGQLAACHFPLQVPV